MVENSTKNISVNIIAFKTLSAICGYPLVEIVTFLLKVNGYSYSKIAKSLGVSSQAVRKAISSSTTGDSLSRIKEEVVRVLGFNPFNQD